MSLGEFDKKYLLHLTDIVKEDLEKENWKRAAHHLAIAIEIIVGDWSSEDKSDDITGIPSNSNNGNSGFSGGCTQPLKAA